MPPSRRRRKKATMANNKLREALTKILNLTNSLDEDCAVDPVEIRDIAKAALAEPVRNCDVGTAEEQEMRFDAFCKGINGCRDCIIYIRGQNSYCHSVWAQMPYVEKEGGAE